MELLSRAYLGSVGFRWLHILAGITWIGLLYYFNLVQVPALAAYGEEGRARNITIDQIARRALWWFRWAAIATLGTGILITGSIENYFQDFFGGGHAARDAAISVGMILGTTMAANVWMIIWKNQKEVLANAVNVLGGAEANPNAAIAGRKAVLASRLNVIFSVPMLFFMVATPHFYGGAFPGATSGDAWTFFIIAIVIALLLELAAVGIFGGVKAGNKLLWSFESHKNAFITSSGMWLVLWILSEVMFGK